MQFVYKLLVDGFSIKRNKNTRWMWPHCDSFCFVLFFSLDVKQMRRKNSFSSRNESRECRNVDGHIGMKRRTKGKEEIYRLDGSVRNPLVIWLCKEATTTTTDVAYEDTTKTTIENNSNSFNIVSCYDETECRRDETFENFLIRESEQTKYGTK